MLNQQRRYRALRLTGSLHPKGIVNHFLYGCFLLSEKKASEYFPNPVPGVLMHEDFLFFLVYAMYLLCFISFTKSFMFQILSFVRIKENEEKNMY